MSHIVGIFHSEADAEKALDAIYGMDIASEDVTLLRGAGRQGDGTYESSDAGALNVPIGGFVEPTHSTQSGRTSAPALIGHGLFNDLPLNDEAANYFRRVADEGSVVVFVKTKDDDAMHTSVERAMRSANPSRVEVLS